MLMRVFTLKKDFCQKGVEKEHNCQGCTEYNFDISAAFLRGDHGEEVQHHPSQKKTQNGTCSIGDQIVDITGPESENLHSLQKKGSRKSQKHCSKTGPVFLPQKRKKDSQRHKQDNIQHSGFHGGKHIQKRSEIKVGKETEIGNVRKACRSIHGSKINAENHIFQTFSTVMEVFFVQKPEYGDQKQSCSESLPATDNDVVHD